MAGVRNKSEDEMSEDVTDLFTEDDTLTDDQFNAIINSSDFGVIASEDTGTVSDN
jgi:hypothetical protein